MIDSHTHLFLCEGDEAELVAAAAGAGVVRMLTVGMNAETNAEAVASSERYGAVFAAIGRHPNEASGFDDAAAAEIRELARHEKVRAIGETGLDFYREHASASDQRRAFREQIEIARELGLPIVIHARDPEGETGAIDEIFETHDAHAGEALEVALAMPAEERLARWRQMDGAVRANTAADWCARFQVWMYCRTIRSLPLKPCSATSRS